MNRKAKMDEELPVYEVEFIPVERRLQDRRTDSKSAATGVERRQYGRRKTDRSAPQDHHAGHAPAKPHPPKTR